MKWPRRTQPLRFRKNAINLQAKTQGCQARELREVRKSVKTDHCLGPVREICERTYLKTVAVPPSQTTRFADRFGCRLEASAPSGGSSLLLICMRRAAEREVHPPQLNAE